MSDECVLAKLLAPAINRGIEGNATKRCKPFQDFARKSKGYESGSRLMNFQSKLTGHSITKICCPKSRNRKSAGSNYQRLRDERAAVSFDLEMIVFDYVVYKAASLNFDTGVAAFLKQHFDYASGTIVTEELAQLLFVVGDAVFFHEGNKIRWRVTSKSRLTKMRVCGNEILGAGICVSEITSTATRDRNLFADAFRVFDYRYLSTPLARFDGAEKSGSAPANDHNVCLI